MQIFGGNSAIRVTFPLQGRHLHKLNFRRTKTERLNEHSQSQREPQLAHPGSSVQRGDLPEMGKALGQAEDPRVFASAVEEPHRALPGPWGCRARWRVTVWGC